MNITPNEISTLVFTIIKLPMTICKEVLMWHHIDSKYLWKDQVQIRGKSFTRSQRIQWSRKTVVLILKCSLEPKGKCLLEADIKFKRIMAWLAWCNNQRWNRWNIIHKKCSFFVVCFLFVCFLIVFTEDDVKGHRSQLHSDSEQSDTYL